MGRRRGSSLSTGLGFRQPCSSQKLKILTPRPAATAVLVTYGTHLHTILVPGTLINRNCEKCSLYENYGCNLVRVNQLRDRNHNFRIDYTFWRRFSVTFWKRG
jgi:hypothetical protein